MGGRVNHRCHDVDKSKDVEKIGNHFKTMSHTVRGLVMVLHNVADCGKEEITAQLVAHGNLWFGKYGMGNMVLGSMVWEVWSGKCGLGSMVWEVWSGKYGLGSMIWEYSLGSTN